MTELAKKALRRTWGTLRLAAQKFLAIDGGQRAAAFAYSALFALFPLIILLAAATSVFTDRGEAAGAVIAQAETFVPLGEDMQRHLFGTVSHVIRARGQASIVALVMLVWVAAQFFTTLIQASNRAWGTSGNNWWKLPLKSLALLAIVTLGFLIGVAVPMAAKLARDVLPVNGFFPAAYNLGLGALSWGTVFFSLAFFYKLAPHRRTRYSEVWVSALCATALLHAAQTLFVMYLRAFGGFDALYGAFGAVMALLLWIYVSGVIFIFCACLSAAQAATRAQPHA